MATMKTGKERIYWPYIQTKTCGQSSNQPKDQLPVKRLTFQSSNGRQRSRSHKEK